MPRPPAATALALGAILSLGACSSGGDDAPRAPEAFCEAARELDEQLPEADLDEQIRLVEALVEVSPEEIRPDAEVFLDALRRVGTDPAVRDDPDVKASVDAVNRYAAQGCGFYERRSPF
ncbi:MAG: hypothetical protein M5U14_14400 [Acidimicrobiia bacterium]|nr:hypothetical protein [Acidimicrobiia bacterium]